MKISLVKGQTVWVERFSIFLLILITLKLRISANKLIKRLLPHAGNDHINPKPTDQGKLNSRPINRETSVTSLKEKQTTAWSLFNKKNFSKQENLFKVMTVLQVLFHQRMSSKKG